jgi:hypothetical protein
MGDAKGAQTDGAEFLSITAATYSDLCPWVTAITTPERLALKGRLWVCSSVG